MRCANLPGGKDPCRFPVPLSTTVALTASSIRFDGKGKNHPASFAGETSCQMLSCPAVEHSGAPGSQADGLTCSGEQRFARVLARLPLMSNRGLALTQIPILSRQVLAGMPGATRPQVNTFLNRISKQRFISCNGRLELYTNSSRLMR